MTGREGEGGLICCDPGALDLRPECIPNPPAALDLTFPVGPRFSPFPRFALAGEDGHTRLSFCSSLRPCTEGLLHFLSPQATHQPFLAWQSSPQTLETHRPGGRALLSWGAPSDCPGEVPRVTLSTGACPQHVEAMSASSPAREKGGREAGH